MATNKTIHTPLTKSKILAYNAKILDALVKRKKERMSALSPLVSTALEVLVGKYN